MSPFELSENKPIDPGVLRESIAAIAAKYPSIDSLPYLRLKRYVNKNDFAALPPPYHIISGDSQRFVRHPSDVILAFQQLERGLNGSSMILESLITGLGYWTLGVVQKGHYTFLGSLDLEWADEIHQFPMGLSFPGSLDSSTLDVLNEFTQELTDQLSISDGPVRLEWIRSHESKAFQLRIISSDSDRMHIPIDILQRSSATAIQWVHSRSGIVDSVRGVNEARAMDGIEVVKLSLSPGERIGHVLDTKSRDALGYVVATGKSRGEAVELAKQASAMIEISTKTVI